MSWLPSRPARRTVLIIRCLFGACFALAMLTAAEADAAEYKMLGCSATAHDPFYTVTGNTASPQNPGGIFNFWNNCGGQGGDPPGDAAYLRLEDNQANGTAANGAFVAFNFDTPNQFIHFRAAGGYTREPASFNEGWRARLLISGGSAGDQELMSQGSGLCNCGDQWATTGVFASHLWPLGGYLDFTRLSFELVCLHVGGCDRTGVNAADLNGMVFVLSDEYRSAVNLLGTDQPFMAGYWVRGPQTIGYNWTELGSGMKIERTKIDGGTYTEIVHNCDEGFSQTNGVYARSYQPCDTAADIKRSYGLETASLADGTHTIAACTQDFAQWQNLGGSGGESCDSRVVHTDNTPPGAPAGLEVTSSNPARYMQHFGARWQLPPNQGSPIAAVHYDIVNAAGAVVVPAQTISATDPTALSDIEGPKAPGDYRLRLWLEDGVGFTGSFATAPIPHDTTPPAAAQNLRAIGPASWAPAQGYQLRWQDLQDNGSPIVAAHYQVLEDDKVVISTKTVSGNGVDEVPDLETPRHPGDYSARVWLEDEEGNVGAAATAAIPRDTTPPAAPQDLSVTSPGTARSSQGFDVHWRNVTDSGSPIAAVHYQVLDGSGNAVVPTQTVTGNNPQAIQDLTTPRQRGDYTLRLWLSDAEGNEGAPVKAPLSYDCVSADDGNGQAITAGLGSKGSPALTVGQAEGSTLTGKITGSGKLGNDPVCVYSRVVTDSAREFLGIALTGDDGSFRFAIGNGPSREIDAVYRSGQRELSASATLRSRVRPTFRLKQKVVHNGGIAILEASIPGPHAEGVVVLFQVRDGKGYRVIRRCLTDAEGRCRMQYHFTRTFTATTYMGRAQIPEQSSYPREGGNSKLIPIPVRP